jgi:hypothetical protein
VLLNPSEKTQFTLNEGTLVGRAWLLADIGVGSIMRPAWRMPIKFQDVGDPTGLNGKTGVRFYSLLRFPVKIHLVIPPNTNSANPQLPCCNHEKDDYAKAITNDSYFIEPTLFCVCTRHPLLPQSCHRRNAKARL